MPSFLTQAFSSYFKRILQFGHAGNNGTPTATTNIEAGDGVATALNLSDDVLSVQPQTDDTTGAFLVKDQGGSNILAVDTSGTGTGSSAKGRVLLGRSQVIANTQYAHFGGAYDSSLYNAVADTHYAIPFNFNFFDALQAMGSSTSSSFNDTNPATTLTISTTAMTAVKFYWYVMDDITIDAVKWLHAADTATGDVTAAHLMAYTVDIANGSTGGDLSSGVVVADADTVSNSGYEQIHYQALSLQNADVDAGKVILFTFASDTINSDYSINATVKYHIR